MCTYIIIYILLSGNLCTEVYHQVKHHGRNQASQFRIRSSHEQYTYWDGCCLFEHPSAEASSGQLATGPDFGYLRRKSLLPNILALDTKNWDRMNKNKYLCSTMADSPGPRLAKNTNQTFSELCN